MGRLKAKLLVLLALPVLIVDPSHVVVYYNEPAEQMLGRRFDEGSIPGTRWSDDFAFTDDSGEPIPASEMMLTRTLRTRQMSHGRVWMRGRDGVRRHMSEVALPLIGNAGRFLGAVAIFDEIEE